ncbi:P-loop containing nucleoside triphosphate hydrolase protein [Cladorrhinum sp. PSN332]|nr:P-loop containing nucleoside triphosphate hydrolase protein [Cladorrhinum sp. PSN332]
MDTNTHGMIMVMGVTGAGKSTFINLLKPGSVEVVHGLKSGSAPPQAVQISLDKSNQRSVTLVDTPGFDDSDRSDADVFQQITRHLAVQHALDIPLKGIIYLHQIHETRMRGSEKRYLDALRRLCGGTEKLGNLVFLTTRWDFVDQRVGIQREQELIDKHWAPMLDRGARVMRFPRSRKEANAMILRLTGIGNNLVLDIQKELVDQESPSPERIRAVGLRGNTASRWTATWVRKPGKRRRRNRRVFGTEFTGRGRAFEFLRR